MTVAAVVSPSTIRQQIEQQPPPHILQSWRREQANSRDRYLLRQTFLVAPDTAVPFSRLRHRIRSVYEERAKPLIVVHYDPWTQEAISATRAKTAAAAVGTTTDISPRDFSANIDLVRSHTTI